MIATEVCGLGGHGSARISAPAGPRLPTVTRTGRLSLSNKVAICVGLTVLGVAAATSAHAQAIYAEPPPGYAPIPAPAWSGLPPQEILRIVRASGLRPLTQPARRGSTYVLLASDNMGGQLRVMIGASNGRILHAAPAHDPRFAYQPVRPRGYIPGAPAVARVEPTYRAPPPDLKDPSPPPRHAARAVQPSASAPSDRQLANAPDITGSIPSRPAQTPLPRPRPAVASNETSAPVAAAPAAPPTEAAVSVPPAERPARAPAAATNAARAKPAETQLVPVAPLD